MEGNFNTNLPSETENQYLFICERLKKKHDIKVKIKQVEVMGDIS